MKIKNYKCKCGHDDFFLSIPQNCIGEDHVGIYCLYCGKWFKWADKDEKNLIMEKNLTMNCVPKIRNDLIKNDDDLIKRQDAIDACFNGKCANIYDCKEAIEKIPSAERKTGKWISRKNEPKYQDRWTCSECAGHFSYKWEYCPICGAKMEG